MRTRYAWGIPGELGLLEIKNSLIQKPFHIEENCPLVIPLASLFSKYFDDPIDTSLQIRAYLICGRRSWMARCVSSVHDEHMRQRN